MTGGNVFDMNSYRNKLIPLPANLFLYSYKLYFIRGPFELELYDITEPARYDSCLHLHLEVDIEWEFRTKLYKRDDFNFLFANSPFMCSNIPAGPTYSEYISNLKRYSIAFVEGELLLTRKLLNQRLLVVTLKWSKLNSRYHDLVYHIHPEYVPCVTVKVQLYWNLFVLNVLFVFIYSGVSDDFCVV